MARATIIPFQPELPQTLPTIHGNVDYREFRELLLGFDRLLASTGLEKQLLESDLEQWQARVGQNATPRAQQTREKHSRLALRCNLARLLLQEDYRGFASRLADSPLLQYFCGLSQVDQIKIPSKSRLQRYDRWWPENDIRKAIHELMKFGAATPEAAGLAEPVESEPGPGSIARLAAAGGLVPGMARARLADGSRISREVMVTEILDLLFQGHELTGNSLTWTLGELLAHRVEVGVDPGIGNDGEMRVEHGQERSCSRRRGGAGTARAVDRCWTGRCLR